MIEIPAALTILTVGLLFLISTIPVSYTSISQSKDVLSGVQIARYQVEQVQNQPFETPSLSTAQTLYTTTSVDNGVTSFAYYYYQVTVSPRLQNCSSSPYLACTPTSACVSCLGQDDMARLIAAAAKEVEVFVYQRYKPVRQVRLVSRISR